MKRYLAGLAIVGLVALAVPAHASTLSVAGTGTIAGVAGSFQLIYDADLNLTWLDYSKGAASWDAQMTWATNLAVTVNGLTYDNWRLSSAGTSTTSGYGLTTAEMGHLYYNELGLSSYLGRGA